MDTQLDNITVNGVSYVRQDQVQKSTNTLPAGNRCVVVVDRGWIWAGDMSTIEKFGQTCYVLSDVNLVLSWTEIGFTGMVANPKSPKVRLKNSPNPVIIPMNSVISIHPVSETWGK